MKHSPRFSLFGCMAINLITSGGFLWEIYSGASQAAILSSGILAFALFLNTLGAVVKYRELTGHYPNLKKEDLSHDEESERVP